MDALKNLFMKALRRLRLIWMMLRINKKTQINTNMVAFTNDKTDKPSEYAIAVASFDPNTHDFIEYNLGLIYNLPFFDCAIFLQHILKSALMDVPIEPPPGTNKAIYLVTDLDIGLNDNNDVECDCKINVLTYIDDSDDKMYPECPSQPLAGENEEDSQGFGIT